VKPACGSPKWSNDNQRGHALTGPRPARRSRGLRPRAATSRRGLIPTLPSHSTPAGPYNSKLGHSAAPLRSRLTSQKFTSSMGLNEYQVLAACGPSVHLQPRRESQHIHPRFSRSSPKGLRQSSVFSRGHHQHDLYGLERNSWIALKQKTTPPRKRYVTLFICGFADFRDSVGRCRTLRTRYIRRQL
jgi:hypothetical protein